MLEKEFINSQIDHLKASTIKRYKKEVELFNAYYNPLKADFSTLADYFEELAKKNYTSQYLITVRAALLKYFHFLVSEELRIDNPVSNIQFKKSNKEVNHNELLSTEELNLILEDRKERYKVLKWRNKLLLSFIRYQALSNSDLLCLTIDHIKNGELKIDAHSELNSNTFKLEAIQMEYFYEWKAVRSSIAQKGVSKLFLNKIGLDITSDGITSIIDTLKRLFPNKKINNKVLRASVIAEHLQKGNDLLATQKFARHKWASTTMKYKNELNSYSETIQAKHPYNFM